LLTTGGVTFKEIPAMCGNVAMPAVLLWLANFSNSVSLFYSGITLTYVVKACIPLCTVIICSLKGQKFPLLTYLSLIPTVIGVALASGTDLVSL